MAFSRRKFLLGIGGAAVGLPFFEGLAPKSARADAPVVPPYALFYRRGNGVQQAIYTRNTYPDAHGPDGYWYQQDQPEPERWWPVMADGMTAYPFGPLTTLGPVSAMGVLESYKAQMTLVKGLRHAYGTENGHPEAAVQGLTGAGVKYQNDVPAINNCVPLGESLDNRIATELSAGKQTSSLYMGFKTQGDSTVSWKKTGGSVVGLAAIDNLQTIYDNLFFPFTQSVDTRALLANERMSVNDLVRDDITRLMNDPRMSSADKDRLNAHLQVIRDTEVAKAACTLGNISDQLAAMDPSMIVSTVDVMGRLAALAISCGVSQSIVMNIGIPQDILLYSEVSAVIGQYPFHAISHRQTADVDGSPALASAAMYHHQIDVFHLQRFKSVLDVLSTYTYPDGTTLVDKGVNVHYADMGAGQHTYSLLPYFYVGGVAGKLVTGQYINADKEYLVKFLNTIGGAVGVQNSAKTGPLDDFNSDNNNYLTRNYVDTYYWRNNNYAKPADGKPAITGTLPALIAP